MVPLQLPHSTEETGMTSPREKEIVRIDLTEDQRKQVRNATGKEGEALELTVQELEERIAPSALGSDPGRLAANHNETFLTD